MPPKQKQRGSGGRSSGGRSIGGRTGQVVAGRGRGRGGRGRTAPASAPTRAPPASSAAEQPIENIVNDDAAAAKQQQEHAPPSTNEDDDDVSTDDKALYRQLSLREQILLRPGMWVGSTRADTCTTWLVDDDGGDAGRCQRMVQSTVTYVPAFLKIFDEILMNAIDHATNQKAKKARSPTADVGLVRNIRVNIDRRTGAVEVVNDGDGIPVDTNENGVYYPELIFGHLLTSSNYDDKKDAGRIVGGQNGIGAKACNIYSEEFEVETLDRFRRRAYQQRFEHNMSVIHPPTVSSTSRKTGFTRVRFVPDYARFGMSGMGGMSSATAIATEEDSEGSAAVDADSGGSRMDETAYRMLVKRVYDAAAITDADVAVHLNGERLECNTFDKFVALHVPEGQAHVYERVNDWWEVAAACCADGNGMQQVSFVNGVCTLRGGKHVDHVVDRLVRKLSASIKASYTSSSRRGGGGKDGGDGIKPAYIRDNLFVFVNATVPSPTFSGQCKDTLSTPASEFGCRVDVSDRFVEKLCKTTGIAERVTALNDATAGKTLSKTDGKKQTSVSGIPKLDDANWAGGAKSRQCTLILTEGDSAKTMAIAGLTQSGRDRFGVYPLRGKVMNVCDVQTSRIAANAEIANLKKILGLEAGRKDVDVDALRYGRVMIMTDQDVDGSHIKGLLFNLFHQMWPSLLREPGFVTSMLTPIVKASRARHPTLEFYSVADFEVWKAHNDGGRGWAIKYYKGLGTSTSAEAKQYFRDLKMTTYSWTGDASSGDALDLAFNKTRANHRKEWLHTYDKTAGLDHGERTVTYEDFVNKDLIHFSNYDVERSIPNICDGFKISQRKILFGCLKKRLLKQQVKVAQLAGYVAEHSAYHHGEASLNATIVGMAQDFVGSNNVNLLQPIGQFGSRIQGGKDSAATRYIHTLLSPLATLLFRPEDEQVLTYQDDDGQPVEPEYYLPVLPTVLLNGALGIGTGFSTNVPSYNPLDVADMVRAILVHQEEQRQHRDEGDGEREGTDDDDLHAFISSLPEPVPWYRGFTGSVETVNDDAVAADDGGGGRGENRRFFSRGVYRRIKPAEVLVTELPLGYWTDDFKEVVDALKQASPDVKDVRHNHSDTAVACSIVFSSPATCEAYLSLDETTTSSSTTSTPPQTRLEKALRLVSNKNLATNFMYLFNHERRIQRYRSVNEIVEEYYRVRLAAYARRKGLLLGDMRARADVLANKIRFLAEVIDGAVAIHRKSKQELEAELQERGYLRLADGTYDYLTRMPLFSLTVDKKREVDSQLEDVRARLAETEATSEREMWRRDLDAFCAKYVDLNEKRARGDEGEQEEEENAYSGEEAQQ